MSVPTRLGVLAIALTALSSRALLAQTNPVNPTNPVGFVATDFTLRLEVKDEDGEKWIFPNKTEGDLFFNKARCECDIPVAIRVDLAMSGVQKQNATSQEGTVKLYAGPPDCVQAAARRPPNFATVCTELATLPSLPNLALSGHEFETTVGRLFRAGTPPAGKGCSARFSQSIMLWVDSDRNGDPDESLIAGAAPNLPIEIDGEPPAPLTNIKVAPGNEALTVKWDRPTVSSEIAGALVFCSRGDLPVYAKPNPFYSPKDYFSRQILCPAKIIQQGGLAGQASAPVGLATQLYQPDAFGGLDPSYLCSNLLTTSTDWRIKILQNDIKYLVGVASVDKHGNASLDTTYVQAPVLSKDFYRAYRDAGGEASGCAYGARGPGGAALAGLALLALVRLRGRRR